jgi:hypothetical protein
MSAQRLADTLTAMGMPYTRTQVTNLEAKRRSTITVSEILMFAAALKVAPGLLLFPVGTDEQVPILPGVNTDAWTATKIFSGEVALTRLTGAPGDPAQRELAQQNPWYVTALPAADAPITVYRSHDTALTGWVNAATREEFRDIECSTPGYTPQELDPVSAAITERHLTVLASTRVEMHRKGWSLPPIPQAAIKALHGPLLAWGYRQDETGELIDVRGRDEHPVDPRRQPSEVAE